MLASTVAATMPRSATPSAIRPDDLVAQPFLEIDADIGMRGQERAQRLGQEFGQRIGVGEHPDLAGEAAGIGAEVLAQPLGLAQDRARMLQQGAAGLGRGHALTSAHQQRRAQRLLHVADAGGGRGQREMRALRPAGDAAGLDHVAKQAQIGEVESHVGRVGTLRLWADLPSDLTKESYSKNLLCARSLGIIFAVDERIAPDGSRRIAARCNIG